MKENCHDNLYFSPRSLSFGLSKKFPKSRKKVARPYFITFEACRVEKFKMLSFVVQTKVDLKVNFLEKPLGTFESFAQSRLDHSTRFR